MVRLKFSKGKQKEFLIEVMENSNCPSLKELGNRMASLTYPSLKNYFSERRNLSQELFEDLCELANLNKNNFSFEILDENWGRSKGGKRSRK